MCPLDWMKHALRRCAEPQSWAHIGAETLAWAVNELEQRWEESRGLCAEGSAPAPNAPRWGQHFFNGVKAYTGWFKRAREHYPEAVFLPDSDSPDACSARAIRWVIDDWTERAERELLGDSNVVRGPLPLPLQVADACVDLSEVLDALNHGAEISPADMRALARCPLAVVASIGAKARVHPTTTAAFWLLAQTQTGTVARDDSWAWHPTPVASRTLVLRIDADDEDDS